MVKILKLKDKHFQGFICDKCGRNLKHAFSIDGNGTYGSECIMSVAGINADKQVKKQMELSRIWNKIVSNPQIYSLEQYVEAYGTVEAVEQKFYQNGCLA